MPLDKAQHARIDYRASEVTHCYGDGIHILSDPVALSILARVCERGVTQPEVNRLVERLYRLLAHVAVASEFPRHTRSIPTRMIEIVPEGSWEGETVDIHARAVVVAVARAGLWPSQITYDFLNEILEPSGVRQDHLALGRTLDSDGRVTGAALGSAKIGGPVDDATVLIPDPMGATGSTVSQVLQHYEARGLQKARAVVALHLIVTPEYLRHMKAHHPDAIVYALRLDRGLSPPHVLAAIPGALWDEERGLTDHQYIVPGGGGLGEVMNNSFV